MHNLVWAKINFEIWLANNFFEEEIGTAYGKQVRIWDPVHNQIDVSSDHVCWFVYILMSLRWKLGNHQIILLQNHIFLIDTYRGEIFFRVLFSYTLPVCNSIFLCCVAFLNMLFLFFFLWKVSNLKKILKGILDYNHEVSWWALQTFIVLFYYNLSYFHNSACVRCVAKLQNPALLCSDFQSLCHRRLVHCELSGGVPVNHLISHLINHFISDHLGRWGRFIY